MKLVAYDTPEFGARVVAAEIALLIRRKAELGEGASLGLVTGASPRPLYRELVRLHRKKGLSFKSASVFVTDEYCGIPGDHPSSNRSYMTRHFVSQVDVAATRVHLPDGADFEKKIRRAGGLDFLVLGIGRNGHLAYNEPGSTLRSRTRVVRLTDSSIEASAPDFGGKSRVPRRAVTMGVGTIMRARSVILLAWGEAKARILADSFLRPPTAGRPASFLQGHPDAKIVADHAAARYLKGHLLTVFGKTLA